MCKYTEMEIKPSKKPRFLLKVIDAPFLLVQKKMCPAKQKCFAGHAINPKLVCQNKSITFYTVT